MKLMDEMHAIWSDAVMGRYEDVDDVLAVTPKEKRGPRCYVFCFNLPEDFHEGEETEMELLFIALMIVAKRLGMSRGRFLKTAEELWDQLA